MLVCCFFALYISTKLNHNAIWIILENIQRSLLRALFRFINSSPAGEYILTFFGMEGDVTNRKNIIFVRSLFFVEFKCSFVVFVRIKCEAFIHVDNVLVSCFYHIRWKCDSNTFIRLKMLNREVYSDIKNRDLIPFSYRMKRMK